MCEPRRPGGLIRFLITDRFANVRNTGLPWYRVLSIALANNLRKARRGQLCCGNLGQPGC